MNASNKRDSVAKMMKAWESKNARRALQGAGLSTMAVTLAACGGSSTTTTTTTPVTPVAPVTPVGQTFTLTIGVDSGSAFVGGDGADTFNAGTVAVTTSTGTVVNNATLTATDVLVGGTGADTLNVTEVTAMTVPSVTVSGIETINLTSGAGVTADISSGFTGVETLNVTAVGATNIDALATVDVNLTATTVGNVTTAVDTAKNVVITNTGVTDTLATIAVGGATGNVTVTQTTNFPDAFDDTAPTISVTGGKSVSITQNLAGASDAAQATDASSETFTGGAVSVTGTAVTTDVTVTQTAANTAVNYAVATAATATATGTLAVAGETGVVNGAVTIADANAASLLAAGTISAVTLNNYGNSTVDSGALTTVNISGTGGTLGLTAGALTTAAVSSLTINASAATAGAITADADYTTVNVAGSTGTSTIANLTATGATTLNVSGDAKVTFTAQTVAAVTDINVTNTAGASFGTAIGNAVTFDAVGGADAVSVGATTKTISMGAGNDTVTVNVSALGTAGAIDAGEGDDTLVMTGANAATASASSTFGGTISGFEIAKVTGTTADTAIALNMANLDSINKVVIDGNGDHTISGITSGFALTLQGATTTATDTVLSFNNVSGSTDSMTITLANNTAGALDFGTLNAAGIETLAITTSDTGTVAAGRQYATVDILDVTAADATTITVTGNNGLNMGTNTAAKVTSFDASGVKGDNSVEDIAANLAVTFVSGNTTAGANLTLTGGAGNDTLTGNKNADTISGGAGNDSLTGSTGADTIDGGAGTDTYVTDAAMTATNIEGAGTGTSTGVAVNLSSAEVTGAFVLTKTGDYLAQGTNLAANTAAYLYAGDVSTNSKVKDTLTSIENVSFFDGSNFFVGSDAANTVTTGVSASEVDYVDLGKGNDTLILNADASATDTNDVFIGGDGTDTIKITADNDTTTGAVLDDLSGFENITVLANTTATHDVKITITYTAANTDALTIDASALTDTGAFMTLVASDNEVDGALTVTGGKGNDVITTGDGADTITGGIGRDVLDGDAGADVYVITAYTDLTLSTALTLANTDSGTDTTAATKEEITDGEDIDYIAWGTGDKINVTQFDADATVAGHQAWTVTVDTAAAAGTKGAGTDGISTGTDHAIVVQKGTWDATNNDFTHDTTGSDSLVVFDDGTNVTYLVVDGAVLGSTDFILA